MEEQTKLPEESEALTGPVDVVDVRFRSGSKTYYFDPNGLCPKDGDHLIIETARGAEYGYCCSAIHTVQPQFIVAPLRKVLRIANAQDEYVNEQNRKLEAIAYNTCQQKIEQLGLDMQLVSCESAFDGSKLLFFFTADGRVDFRELVKQLASNFRTRIELRQIGVRDKAKMVGGLGICGRPFCCGQFLSDFAPVSIKMAKTQNLSLNPTKISGTCGRLMCCLKYEQDTYEDLLKTSPKVESLVDTPDGRGTVTAVNLMHQTVQVRLEKDPDEQQRYRNEEIAVLRSGKAKKNDPPIPDDLAPISGGRQAEAAQELYPRFQQNRPQTEAASEAAIPPAAPAEKNEKRHRRERQKPAAPSAAPAPAPAGAEATPESAHKRRRNRHRNAGAQAAPVQPEVQASPEPKPEAAPKQASKRRRKPDRKHTGKAETAEKPIANGKESAPKRQPDAPRATAAKPDAAPKDGASKDGAPEASAAEKSKKPHHRYYHHRKKPQG